VNKNELIVFLRDPSKLNSSHLNELEEIIEEDPYFLGAHLLLAKGSKTLKDPKTKKRVNSAAIYSTDRVLLKKYLSSNLFFLGQAVTEESAGKAKTKKERIQEEMVKKEPTNKVEPLQPKIDRSPSALKSSTKQKELEIPSVPSGDLDALLDELTRDMENLKSSRHHFAEVQQKIEEEEAISEALNKNKINTPEKADEIEVKEEASEIPKEVIKTAKPKEDLPTSKPNKDAIKIELDPTEEEIFSKKLEALAKQKEEQKTAPEEEQISATNEIIPSRPKEDTETSDSEDERAEKSIDEPRFSRFATRSYLKDLSADFDDDFDFFGDKEEKTTEKATEEEPKLEDKEVVATEAKKETPKQSTNKTKLTPADSKTEKKEETKAKTKKEPAAKTQQTSTAKTPRKTSPNKAKSTVKSTKKEEKTVGTKGTTERKTAKKTTPRKKNTSTSKKDNLGGESKDEGKANREVQQQIIDKFIKESPSIKYTRKDEASSADLAEISSEWDTNLASEYLAEIYLHQGNKKRAKEIYEALTLKYPEKKSYFADLISKIE